MARRTGKGTLFEEIVSVGEQQAFLEGGSIVDCGPPPDSPPPDPRVSAFAELDSDEDLLEAIVIYVECVLPKPRETYLSGLWSISCMPSTSGGGRMFTLSCPGVESLFGGIDVDGAWLRMNVSLDALPRAMWPPVMAEHGFDDETLAEAAYKVPTVGMLFAVEQLPALLSDAAILRAARAFVVDRMRAGGNSYRRYGSEHLASEILARGMPEADTLDDPENDLLDPVVRRALARRARVITVDLLTRAGYVVEDVRRDRLGFDLLGTRGNDEILVKVKGRRSDASSVFVSAQDVEEAGPVCALVVVSGIVVDNGEGYDGVARVWQPWNPTPDSLEAVQFRHVLDLDAADELIW